ncbi:MAG TPA: YeiH family putative sulfate export transporter [Steroidobacteraceae bacterium]|nr:YeiH family putative sulfate export transporter [Steroidobacteraceae bacterium]
MNAVRRSLTGTTRVLPGMLLSAVIALAATGFGTLPTLRSYGVSALTLAILGGLLLANTLYPRIAQAAGPGVLFSRQTLLRAGVVLYGLRLTLRDIAAIGPAAVVIDSLVVSSTFLLSVWLGTRVFGIDRETSVLIGAGSAICGAAAVMATEPVVRARNDHVTIAISTVVLYGTVGMFAYPALYALASHGAGAAGMRWFGVYAGSTIHEVAQVFAAGRSVGESAANTAVITKMVRVMMLAPFLMLLSAWIGRDAQAVRRPRQSLTVPWFAVAFVGLVLFNSLTLLPARALALMSGLDTVLLAMAMAALGLGTRISALRAAGPRPMLLGAALFLWLVAGGAGINELVSAWLP